MIYDGPITDPRHRYYVRPTQPIKYYQELSPRSVDRFAKFRAQPVNLSRNVPVPTSPHLSNSHIYTKQGLLRRNQIGWDGVKLTEYVTEQLAENYLENQRILEKFRADAEKSRRERKFRHAYQARQHTDNELNYLPPISPIVHETSRYANSPIQSDQHLDEYQIIEQIPRYRNVGVNTHKNYEKAQLQKYLKLNDKYEVLKEKYRREREMRRKEKRKFEEREEEREREKASLEKIKDIQTELMNISVKLEASNQFIAEKLAEDNRKKLMEQERNQKKMATRRLRTEPDADEKRWEVPEDQNLSTMQIPQNPLIKMRQDLQREQRRPEKSPTVVYSKKIDFADSKFLTKYARK